MISRASSLFVKAQVNPRTVRLGFPALPARPKTQSSETKTFQMTKKKKENREREKERRGEDELYTVLRKRYGISLDIYRASRTKGGPLPSRHLVATPGTI